MARKAFFKLGLHPLQGLAVLTVRAMTVAAASGDIDHFAAFAAPVACYSIVNAAAAHDGVDGFAMIVRHLIAKALDIPVAICLENVMNRHDEILS